MRALKLGIGVLSAACLMFPAMVNAQCTRSCGLGEFQTWLTVTPTNVKQGQPITITVGVSSSYPVAEVFHAIVNLTPTKSACASFAEAFAVNGTIYPGHTHIFTYTLPAPNCTSFYDVTLNGTLMATLKVD